MMSPQTAAVFFDAVGTLIHPEPSAALVYAEIGRRYGSSYSVADIAARFSRAFAAEEAADHAACLHSSENREFRRWQNIVARVLDDVDDSAACFQELYQHFARPDAWRLEPEAPSVLECLAAKGYLLGLASNYDHRLRSVAAGLAGLKRLRYVVISSEVGWRKPAQEFFAAMCRLVELPAERILYVGDDPVNDYTGARAAGLEAVLFDQRDRHPDLDGRRLRTLAELLHWR
jgi:putative hydrolase of the HAD superfamily